MIKIFNEDCLEGMKKIPPDSVDLIVTDPPFCVGMTANGRKGSYNDFIMLRPFFENLFTDWLRVLKDGGHIYINTDWRTYPFLYPIILKYFEVRNLIIWDYEWIKCGNFYRFSHEFIIFGTKGNSCRKFGQGQRDVWRIKPVNFTSKNKYHPSEKPVELCEKMILNSSKEGDTVLDCFMGSGSTGVACMNTGRNFIGCEIDEKYFKVAEKRITEALALKQQELF